MKHLATFGLIALTLLWASCGDDTSESQSANQKDTQQDSKEVQSQGDEATMRQSATSDLAICLWNQAGLRSQPGRGKDAAWITAISFGEVVSLTGEEQTVESTDRSYLEMELSDGKKGWSYGYLFAVDAMRATALQDVEIYKRPDLLTFEGKKFERGEIFAVKSVGKDEWVEVVGKERDKAGWMRKDGSKYSTDEIDVTVAILIDRAMSESDPKAREEALRDIATNSTFSSSPMLSIVDEKLASIPTIPDLPANQLYVTAQNLNARSEPDNEADNVVFQLQEGDICTILERGDLTEIRDMEDYWYKVSSEGQEGWIFGHFTSKRLAE